MSATLRAPRRHYTVKPTRCVQCSEPLSETMLRNRRYLCQVCYNLRHHVKPPHRGPCLAGCGRPGGPRSGLCRNCNHTRLARRWKRDKVLRAVLGETLPMEWLAQFVATDPRAQDFARRYFMAVFDGRLSVFNPQVQSEVSRRRWNLPGMRSRMGRGRPANAVSAP